MNQPVLKNFYQTEPELAKGKWTRDHLSYSLILTFNILVDVTGKDVADICSIKQIQIFPPKFFPQIVLIWLINIFHEEGDVLEDYCIGYLIAICPH